METLDKRGGGLVRKLVEKCGNWDGVKGLCCGLPGTRSRHFQDRHTHTHTHTF